MYIYMYICVHHGICQVPEDPCIRIDLLTCALMETQYVAYENYRDPEAYIHMCIYVYIYIYIYTYIYIYIY